MYAWIAFVNKDQAGIPVSLPGCHRANSNKHGAGVMVDENPGNSNKTFQRRRIGETRVPPFRTQRLFTIANSWYFKTREGTEQGPYMSCEIAEQAIDVYITEQQRGNRRLFCIGEHWYFSTREGVDQGPFASRESAEKAIDDYIKQKKSAQAGFRLQGYDSIFRKY